MPVNMIGESREFLSVRKAIEKVAPLDSTVLVLGETGTGKEVVARAIHDTSSRRQERFVALNCASLPAELAESELFGHERGAFTGAVSQKPGRFQTADRGTLFLDEIGDLPLQLQPKLLRVLQERQLERLGSDRTIPVNVRVIAATNRDLPAMVSEGNFRADLFYRLNVFPITVPPLRDRPDDIPLLVARFVSTFAASQGKAINRIPRRVIDALQGHYWPGNIRELQNVIERAVIMSEGPEMYFSPTCLGAAAKASAPTQTGTLAQMERHYILSVLEQAGWVVGGPGGAAARLGLARTTLISRMEKLGISKKKHQSTQANPLECPVPQDRFERSPTTAAGSIPFRLSESENGAVSRRLF